MATFLKRGNFSGSSGSHFFLDLYYDVLSANTVRFYAYIGSVDGYSAGGSSSPVYINNIQVTNSQGQPGSISSIPARSNTMVGYVDVSGSGVITGTATCSTPWNGVGSASASGSVSVGPYITNFSVSPRDEFSVTYNWSVSSPADYGWFSLDGVNWYDLPTSNVIGGLTPGQPYNFYIKLRQASTQAEYTSGPYQQSPYNYPYVNSVNDFTIGNPLNIGIYNPLNRNCYIYIQANGTQSGAVYTNTGSLSTTFNTSDWVNWWYTTIPNQKQAQFNIRMIVSDLSRDTTVYGGIYSIKYTEKPIVTVTATDTGKTLTGGVDPTVTTTDLTGDNKKIIKFVSDVQVSVSATAQNSSTITATSTKYGNNTAIQGSTHTYNNVESVSFEGHAMDSRGLSTGVTASGLTLIPYVKLTLENLELYRDDQTSDTLKCKGGGNYFSGSFGDTNNSITFKLRYKESSSSTWGNWETKTMTIGTNEYSFDFTVGTNFDYTKTYNFEFDIKDKCMGVTDSEVAKAGLPVQGLFEDFHEAFGVKTFEKTSTGTKLNGDVSLNGIDYSVSNLIPYVLYNGGSADDITLSDNASNYKYMEIYYTSPYSVNSVKVYNPQDKTVSLMTCFVYDTSGGGTQFETKNVYIHNNQITNVYYSNFNVDNGGTWSGVYNVISIQTVIGYK